MKVAFHRDRFLPALEQAAKVAPTSRAVPILCYVRLDAFTPTTLQLRATDLATSITITTEALVKESGAAILDAQKLLETLRLADVPTVAVATTDSGVLIRAGATWLPKTPPIEQYPTPAAAEEAVIYPLPRADLVRALRLVRPAAATSSFNPRLEQVGIRRGKVQAADGIRFHEVTLPGSDLVDVALPLPFLSDLLPVLSASHRDTVDLGVSEDRQTIIIRHGDLTLTTTCRRDPFPDVDQAFLIPAMAHDAALHVQRAQLVGAIRRVRLLADPTTKAISLCLRTNTVEVRASQPSGAYATETITAEWVGPDRTLTFHHDYLIQLLALFEGETLTLRLGPDGKHKPSPLLIQEDGRTGVLLQLRTDWI